MVYCGIARDHAADYFTFLNPKTRKYVESRDVNLWLNQTYGEYEGLSPPSQLSTVVHVPLENDTTELKELEDIENVPPSNNPPLPRPAAHVPPSDSSTASDNNDQAALPPPLFSPARSLQSPMAKRMVHELQPHLLDPLEEPPVGPPTLTQRNENLRVTRSRGSNANVEDSHSAMAHLAMCDKI